MNADSIHSFMFDKHKILNRMTLGDTRAHHWCRSAKPITQLTIDVTTEKHAASRKKSTERVGKQRTNDHICAPYTSDGTITAEHVDKYELLHGDLDDRTRCGWLVVARKYSR